MLPEPAPDLDFPGEAALRFFKVCNRGCAGAFAMPILGMAETTCAIEDHRKGAKRWLRTNTNSKTVYDCDCDDQRRERDGDCERCECSERAMIAACSQLPTKHFRLAICHKCFGFEARMCQSANVNRRCRVLKCR